MGTFVENLKNARINKGLKQSEVAEKLDCAPTSLTNWENGKVAPSLEVLSKLCEIYEISPLSLLDKEYKYNDIYAISQKPVSKRTYEEQIALNFSEPILSRLLIKDAQQKETQRIEETAAFLQNTNLHLRFGVLTKNEIEAVKADYDKFGNADADILFAFHALNQENKLAFLSMLIGLLIDSDNVQRFNEKMDTAMAFTIEKIKEQRTTIKES